MAVYISNYTELHQLLSDAASAHGATLLIPNLQRPYVWSPAQVVLLIDSLLKGWPFGTLLLWDLGFVRENETIVPSRRFWRTLSRVSGEKSTDVPAAVQPNKFKMVLDGQQRIQSLVFAFGSEAAGIKLLDREWKEAITGSNPYRGVNVNKHWTEGKLYLDLCRLNAFKQDDGEGGYTLPRNIAMQEVLCWVASGNEEFENSSPRRPSTYERPLPLVSESLGRYLNCARLWQRSVTWQNTRQELRDQCKKLLRDQGLDDHQIEEFWPPLRELVSRFKEAQSQQVDYHEIRSFTAQVFGEESIYREAVVNIFTRLNTGGRTLTREEITFAWIKVEWDASEGIEQSANDAFEALREELRDEGVALTTDDLVRLLSVVWAAAKNQGKLLTNRDLLDGITLRQLAHWLRLNWELLDESLRDTVQALRKQGLMYGHHYRSLNALALLLSIRYLGDFWHSMHQGLGAPLNIAMEVGLGQFLAQFSERWLIISQWAGVWAQSTDEAMRKYLQALADAFGNLASVTTSTNVLECMQDLMGEWLLNLQNDAKRYINALEAQNRAGVNQYFLPLWVWHRYDTIRAEQSGFTLKEAKSRAALRLEVDHIVPYVKWDELCRPLTDEAIMNEINHLGNTALLSKTFNISKNATPLDEWLQRLEPIPGFDPDAWKNSLIIGPELTAELTDGRLEGVREAIRQRTDRIRTDLVNYIEARVP